MFLSPQNNQAQKIATRNTKEIGYLRATSYPSWLMAIGSILTELCRIVWQLAALSFRPEQHDSQRESCCEVEEPAFSRRAEQRVSPLHRIVRFATHPATVEMTMRVECHNILQSSTGRLAPFQHSHLVQDCRNDMLVPYDGIEHDVVERAGGPVGAEIVFYKFDSVAINGFHQIFSFAQALAQLLNAA